MLKKGNTTGFGAAGNSGGTKSSKYAQRHPKGGTKVTVTPDNADELATTAGPALLVRGNLFFGPTDLFVLMLRKQGGEPKLLMQRMNRSSAIRFPVYHKSPNALRYRLEVHAHFAAAQMVDLVTQNTQVTSQCMCFSVGPLPDEAVSEIGRTAGYVVGHFNTSDDHWSNQHSLNSSFEMFWMPVTQIRKEDVRREHRVALRHALDDLKLIYQATADDYFEQLAANMSE